MNFTKPPLDIPEQIALLKNRGMSFADEARASRVLSHVNYYRLRAYWLPFEKVGNAQTNQENHMFVDGTDFDSVYSPYVFDSPWINRSGGSSRRVRAELKRRASKIGSVLDLAHRNPSGIGHANSSKSEEATRTS